MSERYHITIARQFGSLGRPIGMKLAQELNIEFYDRDIIEEAAKRMDLALSDASDIEENEKKGFAYMKTPLAGRTVELREQLFEEERRIILEWSARESCVIVGRCSNYILRDDPDRLSVFIYAPYEARLKNCIEELGMSQKQARRMIIDVDKARDQYHRRYTRFKAADFEYNDLMIDSSVMGVDGTAEVLGDIARRRFHLA